jgi:hypothetical protein
MIALAALAVTGPQLRAQQGVWERVMQTDRAVVEWKPSSLKSTPAEYWNEKDRYLIAWVRKTYQGNVSPTKTKVQMYELYICRDQMLITYKINYDEEGNVIGTVRDPIHAMDTFNWSPIVPDSEVEQVRNVMVKTARQYGLPMGYN